MEDCAQRTLIEHSLASVVVAKYLQVFSLTLLGPFLCNSLHLFKICSWEHCIGVACLSCIYLVHRMLEPTFEDFTLIPFSIERRLYLVPKTSLEFTCDIHLCTIKANISSACMICPVLSPLESLRRKMNLVYRSSHSVEHIFGSFDVCTEIDDAIIKEEHTLECPEAITVDLHSCCHGSVICKTSDMLRMILLQCIIIVTFHRFAIII